MICKKSMIICKRNGGFVIFMLPIENKSLMEKAVILMPDENKGEKYIRNYYIGIIT